MNQTFRRPMALILLPLSMLVAILAGPVSAPVVDSQTPVVQELAAPAEASVPARFRVGIARDVAVGPFEERVDVIRTDVFAIGGTKGKEHLVGSVKIEARHLRERFDSIVAGQIYEIMGNGRFTVAHRSGRSANLSLRNYCNGHTDFATEVKITVLPTARAIYMGYRPTTKRYFVRGNDINCDDRRALKTSTTPISPPRKPGGGSW